MNKEKKGQRPSLKYLFSQSIVFSYIVCFVDFLYRSAKESLIGSFFCSYDRLNEMLEDSILGRIGRALSPSDKIMRPLRFKIAAQFDHSFLFGKFKSMLDRLAARQLSVYGTGCLVFGLFSAICIVIRSLPDFEDMTSLLPLFGDLSISIAALIAGICLIGSRKHFAEAVSQNSLLSSLLFRIACVKEEYFRSIVPVRGGMIPAFILGALLGISAGFIKPYLIPLGIAALIGMLLFAKSPEFGVIFVLFALPFLPTMGLAAILSYLIVCFFIKYLRGKRVLHFGWLDVTVILFMVILLIAGPFSASPSGSLPSVLVFLCFMCGYFLVVNLIRSSAWLKRAVRAILSSCALVSLYGIYQNFFTNTATTWQDTQMFSDISGRVVSTFENPNVLGEYLIMCLPVAIAGFFLMKKTYQRIGCFLLCGVIGGCLIFTWSRGAWLGFMIGILLFLLMYSRKTLIVMLFGIFGVPFLPYVLPASITNRFLSIGNLSDTSTSYRVHIWEGVIRMLKDHFLGGIGVGVDAFQTVYPLYALSCIEAAPHSHNLYLQIVVETGIFGLLVFLTFLLAYAQFAFTHFNKDLPENKRVLMAAFFCGTVAVLAQGLTDYIWYNYRVFLVFWLMIGMTVATARTALSENRSETPDLLP